MKPTELFIANQKELLRQALSHRRRLEQAVKAAGVRDGTCWCGVTERWGWLIHTKACDALYAILYGGERGT